MAACRRVGWQLNQCHSTGEAEGSALEFARFNVGCGGKSEIQIAMLAMLVGGTKNNQKRRDGCGQVPKQLCAWGEVVWSCR